FFFQAEDGIRDRTVTGVQTCALPISRLSTRFGRTTGVTVRRTGGWKPPAPIASDGPDTRPTSRHNSPRYIMVGSFKLKPGSGLRSEERRVGKEGRCQWAPEHEMYSQE